MAAQLRGRCSVVGGTFWINTKPVTVVGIVPEGFYGDRMSVTPAEFYLPIEAMPALANSPYVHDPEQDWLYIIGRIKPGVAIAPLQEKVTAAAAAGTGNECGVFRGAGKENAGESARRADAGRRGHPGDAGVVWIQTASVDVDCQPRAVDSLRQYCESSTGARDGTARGVLNARCAGSHARKNHSSIAYGKCRAGRIGRYRRTRRRLCRGAHAADSGFSKSGEYTDPHWAVAPGPGVRLWSVAADGGSFWCSAGVDCGTGGSDRCGATQHSNDGDERFCFATWAGGGSGWTFAGAAGCGADCSCRA